MRSIWMRDGSEGRTPSCGKRVVGQDAEHLDAGRKRGTDTILRQTLRAGLSPDGELRGRRASSRRRNGLKEKARLETGPVQDLSTANGPGCRLEPSGRTSLELAVRSRNLS